MDIVRILQNLAAQHQLEYHYGKKAALNLLDGNPDVGTTYLLHEFTNRKGEYNQTGTAIVANAYTGKFFLVKQSDFTQPYFAGRDSEPGKYTQNIEPLLEVFRSLGNALACIGAVVTQWENIDVTDALDANMDGLLCSYSVRIEDVHD